MDHALLHRRDLIESVSTPVNNSIDAQIERCAASLAAKRIKALNHLGDRWVMHPQYDRHSNAHHSPAYKTSATLLAFTIGLHQQRLGAF